MHEHEASCAHAEAPNPVPGHPVAYAPGQVPYPAAVPDSRLYRLVMTLGTKPSWLAPLSVIACLGAAFTYVLANDPTDNQRDPLGPCIFKSMTGLDCPGCGGTRMVWYLLHGDLGQAARHHLMALIAVPVLLYAYVAWGAKRVFNIALPTRSVPMPLWAGYLAAWAVFAVARNLPWQPFHYFYVS